MKKLFYFLFNSNTGWFINTGYYDFEGDTYEYYILCKGYRFLGIPGYARVAHCYDMEQLRERIVKLEVPINISDLC
jgi:hypothetical protein